MSIRKAFLIFLLLAGGYSRLAGQVTGDHTMAEIKSKINNREWYEALDYVNHELDRTNAELRLLPVRAWLYLRLNDWKKASNDLRKYCQMRYATLPWYYELLYDPERFANKLVENEKYTVHLTASNGFMPPVGREDTLRGALRMERQCYDVTYYGLEVAVFPGKKEISGSTEIIFKVVSPTRKIQVDLASALAISAIRWKDRDIPFTRECDAVFVNFPEELAAGTTGSIKVFYSGKPRIAPAPPWNGGFVWKKKRGKPWIGVACEHLGASSWWPCKDHLSDRPDSMDITIITPPKLTAISNGNLISVEKNTGGWKYKWHVSYPIANYLVTFYIGNFVNISEQHTNKSGSYAMDFYVLPHNLEKAKNYYNQMKKITEVYEDLFGEYPFPRDGIGMVEAPYAGMENQSAIAIGDNYGRKNNRPYAKIDYDYLLIHETAHEWWGNTVGMQDMADAWLSESFATYTEYLFMERVYGYDKYIELATQNMGLIWNLRPMVGRRGVNDNTFLCGDIYHKGASMLHNLRCLLDNDTLFFRILKNYNLSHRNQVLTTDQCISWWNQATGMNLTPFFNKFLRDTNPPELAYSFVRDGKNIILTYRWTGVEPGFVMPFLVTAGDGRQYRLMATTESKSTTLDDAGSFAIGTLLEHPASPMKNALTWFWSSYEKATEMAGKDGAGNITTRGYMNGTQKTGTWKSFYPDGTVREVSHYLNGRLNGAVQYLSGNGAIVSEETYRDDTLEGPCRYYHENGKIRASGKYVNARQDSTWEFFNTDGLPAARGDFRNGEAVETSWHYYDAAGKESVNDSVFISVSIAPQYMPGEKKMYDFVRDHISPLPGDTAKPGQGKTFIRFTVTRNGSLKDFEIIRTDSPGAALAIIESLKKISGWMPGYLNGEAVNVKVILPFRIGRT